MGRRKKTEEEKAKTIAARKLAKSLLPKKPRKPRKPITEETRKKISLARRARKVQPREGKTKHSNNFLSEMLKDYAKSPRAMKWISENRDKFLELGYDSPEKTKEIGVSTTKDEVFSYWRNFFVGTMTYDPEKERYGNNFNNNQISQLEEDLDFESEYMNNLNQEEGNDYKNWEDIDLSLIAFSEDNDLDNINES